MISSSPLSWRSRLSIHPACKCFPALDETTLGELAADLQQHGLRNPIVFWGGNEAPEEADSRADDEAAKCQGRLPLLDGRNRLDGCAAAGLLTEQGLTAILAAAEIRYGDPVAYVVSANLRRRHLTESQRAMVATKIADLPPGGSQMRKFAHLTQEKAYSQQEAADLLGVSRRSVQNARTVITHGAANVQKAVERGEARVSAAAAAVRTAPQETQNTWTSADIRAAARTAPRTKTIAALRAQPSAPPATPPAETPSAAPVPPALIEIRTALAGDPETALDALAKTLVAERGRIADIAHDARIVLARRLLSALGLTPHDLIATGAAA